MNNKYLPLAVYVLLGLLVMTPLLLPGFIFTLDMAFVPHLPLVDVSRSSFPFYAALHWLSYVVPADILQKILLLGILVLSGWGAHRLVEYIAPKTDQLWKWGGYFAGVLYTINPFVYDRFMAGQFAVLMGYALLPFFVRALFVFLAKPDKKQALWLALWAVAIGIVSVHTLGLAALVACVAGGITIWRHRRNKQMLRGLGIGALLAVGIWLFANVYWLAPLVMGAGSTAAAVGQFDSADRSAFATLGAGPLGQVVNILSLQGFWAEDTGLYTLPQDKVWLWGVLAVLLVALVAYGGYVLLRQGQRFVGAVLAACGLLAVVIATGWFGDLLARIIPFFAGYREPQKFVGLLALVFAVFAAAGFVMLLRRSRFILAGLALPLLLTPTMLWGFGGQLSPSPYPDDWFVMNQRLKNDKQATTLFLPWHRYMVFGFSGRIIENPAVNFFETPIVVTSDPEFRGIKPVGDDARTARIHELIKGHDTAHFAAGLAELDVKYVLVAKEYDYIDFAPFTAQPDMQPELETENLTLYRNRLWKE